MVILATALHILAAVVWVGGMFFAYLVLRPATGPMQPPERLGLWNRAFAKFFVWVWVAVIVLLLSGYWLLFDDLGGFAAAGVHAHIMQGIGLLMMLLFVHLYAVPYQRFRRAVAASEFAAAAAALNQIRVIVATNLVLGLVAAVVGATGRHWE